MSIYSDPLPSTQCVSLGPDDNFVDISDIDAALADFQFDEDGFAISADQPAVMPEPPVVSFVMPGPEVMEEAPATIPDPERGRATATLDALRAWRVKNDAERDRQKALTKAASAERHAAEREARRVAARARRTETQRRNREAARAAKRPALARDIADVLSGLDGLEVGDASEVERWLEASGVAFIAWLEHSGPRQRQLRGRREELLATYRHVLVERARTGADLSYGRLAKLLEVEPRAARNRMRIIRDLEAPGGPWHATAAVSDGVPPSNLQVAVSEAGTIPQVVVSGGVPPSPVDALPVSGGMPPSRLQIVISPSRERPLEGAGRVDARSGLEGGTPSETRFPYIRKREE